MRRKIFVAFGFAPSALPCLNAHLEDVDNVLQELWLYLQTFLSSRMFWDIG